MRPMTRIIAQEAKDAFDLEIFKKIDTITHDLSRAYFNTILRKLARDNNENATIICDYIITEQTEINLKASTKEGKIKVLSRIVS